MTEEVFCNHEELAYRRKQISGGVLTLRKQCQKCGLLIGGAVKRSEVSDFNSTPFVDEILEERGHEARSEFYRARSAFKVAQWQAERDAEREAENAEWWDRYNEHIASPQWAATRAKVLRRANGVCEGCADRRPNHVHHTTYKHVGNELLFELVALCEPCHQKIHPHREIVYEHA